MTGKLNYHGGCQVLFPCFNCSSSCGDCPVALGHFQKIGEFDRVATELSLSFSARRENDKLMMVNASVGSVGIALQARIDGSEMAILVIHEFHTDG